MNVEADPSPFSGRMWANYRETFIFADQCEGVAKPRFVLRLECIAFGIKARPQILQKPGEIAFAFVRRNLAPQLGENALQLHRV